MAGISIRRFIRWVPDEASEPTSTVVLTSPERRFVDIRVLLPGNGNRELSGEEEILPIQRLDWAMAGTSSSEIFPDGHSRSRWSHWINSRVVDAEAASDEGDMYPQQDPLLTLEKGRMVNPDTGKDTDYEEMWFDPAPKPIGGAEKAECVVLRMEDGKRRGLFVRLGELAQVLVRDGPTDEDLVAERWEWNDDGRRWRRKVRLGKEERELPCGKVLNGDVVVRSVGDEVVLGNDEVWKAVEVVEL